MKNQNNKDNINSSLKEEVKDSVYYLDNISDGEQEEYKKTFFRTKDKRIAAFLKARGYLFRGMEKVLISDSRGDKKEVIVFCFDGKDVTRRSMLDYYNSNDATVFTVNAKLAFEEWQNITSLIANF